MPAIKQTNGNKKLWIATVTAIVSLISSISIAIIQTSSASDDDVKKLASNAESMVTHLNEQLIPKLEKDIEKLQDKMDDLQDSKADLRERLARCEERIGIHHSKVRTYIADFLVAGEPEMVVDIEEEEPKKNKLPRFKLEQRLAH